MLPNLEILVNDIDDPIHPNNTYNAVIDKSLVVGNEEYKNRIDGYVDDLDSIEQAIYMILGTERYKFPIYSWDYGVELVDLYGKPMSYIKCELPERIKEALMTDDRISDVSDFTFTQNGKKLGVSFTVITIAGDIPADLEVEV